MSLVPLTPDLLVRAYCAGVFPMAESREDDEVFWVDPKERGVIPLDGFHVPKSLRKVIRQDRFEVRCDTAFDAVIDGCSLPRPGHPDTWINAPIRQAYAELFDHDVVHTVECWRDNKLVGGLYGVALGGAFCGESMFSIETDASKVALVHLVARLRLGGFQLLDTQFVNEHLLQFGCIEIPARDYQQRLADALTVEASFPSDPPPALLTAMLNSVLTG